MGLVYSTEAGRMCPGCRQPASACTCRGQPPATPAGDGIARVGREKQGRGGKLVTVVRGLPLDAQAMQVLGKHLRTACGAGGTVKDGAVEIQGDHAERVIALLAQKGLPAKRAGG
jgi:translation initiation factor 1